MSGTFARLRDGMGDSAAGTGAREDDIMHYANDHIYQEGVVLEGDLAVTEKGAGADMSVDVAPGEAYVKNDSWMVNTDDTTRFWKGLRDGIKNISISSNSSGNDRIDIITMKVDTAAVPDDDASNVVTITVVEGTPAASPSAPATPSNSLKLAEVLVQNGASSIVDADITDSRQYSGLRIPFGLSVVPQLNGNIHYYDKSDNLVDIFVPTTGDIQGAIDSAAGTCPVHLSTGTHTPASEISSSDNDVAIIGAGRDLTTIDASAFTVASQSILKHEDGDNLELRDFRFEMDTNSDKALEVLATNNGVGGAKIFNVSFGSVDTGRTAVYTSNTAGSNFNWMMDHILIGGTGTGTGLDFQGMQRSNFGHIKIDVDTGTPWDFDANSDKNFMDVISDTAGTDNGAGNVIREILF